MFRALLLAILSSTLGSQLLAQDSTRILAPATVQSFLYNRPMADVPVSIGFINTDDLSRYSDAALLPAINTIAGVRMEERSPGSYRLSIRGSLIRSPFGVRNVKMYWNRLPLTDGGGNTYINLLDFSSVGSVEIIKGPAASLYGAGTGGVILLSSLAPLESGVTASTVVGSYGLKRYQLNAAFKDEKFVALVNLVHQESEGYRQHAAMERKALNADLTWQANSKNVIAATVFATDLYYQTPGGLTKDQFKENPKQARPTVGMNLGAVDQKAFVENKSIYTGLNHDLYWNDRITTHTGVFYSKNDFVNYSIRRGDGVDIRDEMNFGLRSETQFDFNVGEWQNTLTAGFELQKFVSPIGTYDNNEGTKSDVSIKDDLASSQSMLFLQSEFSLDENWFITVGASVNWLDYDFERLLPDKDNHHRTFDPVISPRIALLKKFGKNISLFGSVSSGYSPPSLAEVRPSTNTYSNTLDPERGLNTEFGVRGTLWRHLEFNLTSYLFNLSETIVLRRTETDAEYFVNAGKTNQRGFEATVSWEQNFSETSFIKSFKIWTSQSFNHYRFEKYINDEKNYSGNKLTGLPPTVIVGAIDVITKPGLYTNVTCTYTDHIPLDDANSVYADEYVLLGFRLGYKGKFNPKLPFDIFAGIDNLLDKTYSLGNDLNAPAGRFYNVAAGRNYFAGVRINSIFKR